MPRRPRNATPSFCLHKATGQGYVKLNGKPHYIGPYNKPESRQKYLRLLAEWEANGRQPIGPTDDVRVMDLIERYWQWAKTYYRKQNGTSTSQQARIRVVMRKLKEMYGYAPLSDFGPQQLKAVRQVFVATGLRRRSINDYIGHIKHCFKWGVEEGIVPPEVYGALHVVSGLKKGRSDARESEPVRSASEDEVEAVKPYLSPQVVAMIELQLLTAARPGEIVQLRPVDIDMSDEVWVARLEDHKTAHHGHERTIPIGKRSQAIIRPYLQNRAVHMPLFSPRDAAKHRYARADTHRRANQEPTPRQTRRTIGDSYTTASYRRAIHRACDEAGIRRWSPNRLRHTAATRIRAEFGLEAAQVILGHSKADVTQVYAERDAELGKQVARIYG